MIKKNNINALNIIFSGLLIVFLFIFYQKIYINQDAAYYLSVARDEASGDVMYKDIYNAYTLLFMHVNALWYMMFDNPSIHFFIIFQLFLVFIIGYIFYKIQIKQSNPWRVSIFMSLILVLSILELDGTSIILEPYCVLFFMLSYLSILYRRYVLSGILVALCVLSKQYGVLNILPLVLLIHVYHANKESAIMPILRHVFGGLMVLGIFIGYYVFLEQVDTFAIIQQLSGQSYAESHFSFDFKFKSLFTAKHAWLVILLSVSLAKKSWINRVTLILFLGFLLNGIPLLVQTYPHYFLLLIPYAFLIYSYTSKKFNPLAINIFAIIMLAIFIKFTYYFSIREDIYQNQLHLAEQVEKYYPKGSDIFLDGEIRILYLLNNYKNPLNKEIGYSFEYDLDTINTEDIEILSYDILIDKGIIPNQSIKLYP